jgi:hypothetical protein
LPIFWRTAKPPAAFISSSSGQMLVARC